MPLPLQKQVDLAILGLKGCAQGVSGRIGVARAYRDLVCGTAGFHIMVIAVLHAAFDPLDMLAAAGVFVSLIVFHLRSSFHNTDPCTDLLFEKEKIFHTAIIPYKHKKHT